MISTERFNKVFMSEFDAQYLLKIIDIWIKCIDSIPQENESISKMLNTLDSKLSYFFGEYVKKLDFSKLNGFSFNIIGFLSKKEKELIKIFFEKVKDLVDMKACDNKEYFEKIKKSYGY